MDRHTDRLITPAEQGPNEKITARLLFEFKKKKNEISYLMNNKILQLYLFMQEFLKYKHHHNK